MRLKADDREADETVMPVFVFCATFVVIGAFMISLMTPLFASPDAEGNFALYEGYEIIGDITYALYDPDTGYDMSTANVTLLPVVYGSAGTWVSFSNSSVSDRIVSITRDFDWHDYTVSGPVFPIPDFEGHTDFITIYTQWGPWYNSHEEYLIIDYSSIPLYQVQSYNQSAVPFTIHGTSEVLIITTPGNETDFESNLWANNFNIAMGTPAFSTDAAETSMWKILGQLMTASLPNVHPLVNLLIAVPFWASLAFLGFTLLVRVIPF